MTGFDTLDFSLLRRKLMDLEEGPGWSRDLVARVEVEYVRYLALSRLVGDRSLVPSKLVDTFWHYHILDTQAYAADCEHLFGSFLHHFPYFGMRGDEDASNLERSYEVTLEVYKQHFGDAPAEIWPRAGKTRCPKCGRGHES